MDDLRIRRHAFEVLSAAGYRVLEAAGKSDVQDVLAAGRDPVPLVLIDVASPGLNGIEIAEQVRRSDSSICLLLAAAPGVVDPARLEAARVGLVPRLAAPAELLRLVHEALVSVSR